MTTMLLTELLQSLDHGSYHIGDQRRLRRACASAQSRLSHRCSHTLSMEVDEGLPELSLFAHMRYGSR